MITIGDLLGVLFVVVWWIAVFVTNLAYFLLGLLACSVVTNGICLVMGFYKKEFEWIMVSLVLSVFKVFLLSVFWFGVL